MDSPPVPVISSNVQEGGTLYTWGGMAASGGRAKAVRDGHRGCLGVGDTAGRLLPTMCALACFAALPSAGVWSPCAVKRCELYGLLESNGWWLAPLCAVHGAPQNACRLWSSKVVTCAGAYYGVPLDASLPLVQFPWAVIHWVGLQPSCTPFHLSNRTLALALGFSWAAPVPTHHLLRVRQGVRRAGRAAGALGGVRAALHAGSHGGRARVPGRADGRARRSARAVGGRPEL